jgi:hypothetical protein
MGSRGELVSESGKSVKAAHGGCEECGGSEEFSIV